MSCLEQGTQKLEEGDVQSAKTLYQRSVEIKRSASSLFNLGVTHYHLSTSELPNFKNLPLSNSFTQEEFDAAIEVWKECITLSSGSADAHTSTEAIFWRGGSRDG